MAMKYGKKEHKQNNVLYTVVTAVLLCTIFLVMVGSLYNSAHEEAYETLHVQTKQIKDDITLQLLSDRENLATMANFAAKLYSDGESYDLMFESFKPIGLIENIGILNPDNTFVTKAGSINLDGLISFEEETAKDAYISGRMKDLVNPGYELIRSAVPIVADNETVGVLYGVIKLDKINERYGEMVQELDAQLFVYEKTTGDLVIDTVHDELGNISFMQDRKYNEGSYEQLVTTDKGFVSFKSAYRNESLYLHYSAVEDLGWMIAMGRYDSQVFAKTHTLAQVLVTTFIIMLAIMALYICVLMLVDRKIHSVTACAAEVRKELLETLGPQNHIEEALKKVCEFAEARSTLFFDSDGNFYHYVAPEYTEIMRDDEDRKYFRQEMFRYAADYYKVNSNTINIMYIKADDHLNSTSPEFYQFLKTYQIEEVLLSATIDNTNHITILATINTKHINKVSVLAEEISACFSMALFNKNHLDNVKRSATTDALTGTFNRVAYKTDLETFNAQKASDFSCVYVDVNELHSCNNIYGHAAGDAMLLYIANTLKKVFYGHKVYRMGGDEFVVFCENTAQETVKKNIEFLVEQLEPKNYHVAIGMSYRTQNTDTEEMVKEAEKRMYEAKAAFYQNKAAQTSTKTETGYVLTETGIPEIDTMLSVLKEKYNGIYRVSLDTDKAKRILMPTYLNYNEDEAHYSRLFSKYVEQSVEHEDHRSVLSFLNYDAIKVQLKEGKIPTITYKKIDGETVTLSVYKLGDETGPISDTLWVFAKK